MTKCCEKCRYKGYNSNIDLTETSCLDKNCPNCHQKKDEVKKYCKLHSFEGTEHEADECDCCQEERKIVTPEPLELSEMLARGMNGSWKTAKGSWRCEFMPMGKGRVQNLAQEADTEADARAKMLIYLLENSLIKSLKE